MNSKDIIKRNDEILGNAMNFALCKTEMCYNDIALLASHYKMKFPKYMDYLIKAYSPYRFCAVDKHDKISNFLIKLRNKILKEEFKMGFEKRVNDNEKGIDRETGEYTTRYYAKKDRKYNEVTIKTEKGYKNVSTQDYQLQKKY